MSAADEFLAKQAEVESARKSIPEHPKGWEPGLRWNGKRGNILAQSTNKAPDWSALLREWDMDPDVVEVEEPVEMRSWDAAIGNGETQRMFYYKARIRLRREDDPDIGELLGLVRKRKRPTVDADPQAAAYVLGFCDLQLGKKGTPIAVDRVVQGIENSAKRLRRLRKKRSIGSAHIPNLGDIGEACDGHYDMQTFEVELSGREQARLGRKLYTYAIEQHRGLVESVIGEAVPGNHGEKRNERGKAYTSFGDNVDLEISEGVAEAYDFAGVADVHFVIPENELTITLDIGGQVVTMLHGHQTQKTRGQYPQDKVRNWWVDQMAGRLAPYHSDLLLSAHYHQHWIVPLGTRYNIGFPTVEARSQWWDETHGTPSKSGMLSLVIGKDYPLGFGDWDFT